MNILIAEDTKDLNRNLSFLFHHEGYHADSAYDGQQALEFLKHETYDCIILDIMMPNVDGIGVLRELRQRNNQTPVLLLTAKTELEDRVNGLDEGADDYLAKPFSSRELLARVRALIRRGQCSEQKTVHAGDITLDPSTYSLCCASSVQLSRREYEVMMTLMSNPDLCFSTDWFLEHIWKGDSKEGEETVWLYISYLRRKLVMIGSSAFIIGERGGSFQLTAGGHA